MTKARLISGSAQLSEAALTELLAVAAAVKPRKLALDKAANTGSTRDSRCCARRDKESISTSICWIARTR